MIIKIKSGKIFSLRNEIKTKYLTLAVQIEPNCVGVEFILSGF